MHSESEVRAATESLNNALSSVSANNQALHIGNLAGDLSSVWPTDKGISFAQSITSAAEELENSLNDIQNLITTLNGYNVNYTLEKHNDIISSQAIEN